jgi:hypothetical protein
MRARSFLLILAIPFFACAGAPEEETPNEPSPIKGSCPPCAAGQTCVNGACQAESCGPANCATGCCSDNHCVSGTSASACGRGGGLCDECRSDETCDAVDHFCGQKSCDATNCKNGCCDGTTCKTTIDEAHCGSGGQKCDACVSGEKCELVSGAHQCVAESKGTYQIVLVSATVHSKKSDGSNWDTSKDSGCLSCLIGCCPPDVYANDASRFGSLQVPKLVISDDTNPSWNIVVGELDAAQLAGATVHIELADEDVSILTDDKIGSCDTVLTANDVSAGILTLSPQRGCASGVDSVVFAINPS